MNSFVFPVISPLNPQINTDSSVKTRVICEQ
jgi:hypothetical protein